MEWVKTDGAPTLRERHSRFAPGTHYYTLATRDDRGDAVVNKAPTETCEHSYGFLSLYCWGGNECSLGGIPETHPEEAEAVEYFAVDVQLKQVGLKELDNNELHVEAADHRGGEKFGNFGSDGTANFSVFKSASIRNVVPGQEVRLEGARPITTERGDIELDLRVGGLMWGGAAVPHLMRPVVSTREEIQEDALHLLMDFDHDAAKRSTLNPRR